MYVKCCNVFVSLFLIKNFSSWCGLLCRDFFKSTIEVIRIFISGLPLNLPRSCPLALFCAVICCNTTFFQIPYVRECYLFPKNSGYRKIYMFMILIIIIAGVISNMDKYSINSYLEDIKRIKSGYMPKIHFILLYDSIKILIILNICVNRVLNNFTEDIFNQGTS